MAGRDEMFAIGARARAALLFPDLRKSTLKISSVVVSNQPGIARNNFDEDTLTRIDARMRAEIGVWRHSRCAA